MFGKTLGLLQLSSQTRRMNNRRTKAAAVLRKTAAKTGSQQLVSLANLAKIAGFEKVKEAIQTMIDELKVQQKDEVKHRDWCIEEFAENKKQTVLNQDTMEDLQAPQDRLPKKLAGLQPAAALSAHGAARYGLVFVRSVQFEQQFSAYIFFSHTQYSY